jgi:hypothetical protein
MRQFEMAQQLEYPLLVACREVILRQGELMPQLAETVGVRPEELFYTWAFRKCRQHGRLHTGDWAYFFHGLECDLRNTADGRFLRVDFGPGGRLDTFTAWGVLQFIMASKPPWPEFRELKSGFAETPPPFDEYSGSLAKLGMVFDRIEELGLIEKADEELARFAEEHTHLNPEGIRVLSLPPETPEHVYFDISVCNRRVLSAKGLRMRAQASAPQCQ